MVKYSGSQVDQVVESPSTDRPAWLWRYWWCVCCLGSPFSFPSFTALIVPSLYNSFGVFMMRQFMFSIPAELLDSARLDGCSEFRIFWSIALPLAKSAAGALSLLNLMVYWNWFFWPLIVLNSEEKFTISLTLTKFMGLYWTEYGPLTAGSFLAVVPIVITFLFLQRYFVEGIATTGMKG